MINSISWKSIKYIIITAYLLLMSTPGNAQQNNDIFEGYVFSEDSVPVEDAYIINYRNMKIVTSDSNGYFKTPVNPGDSLMINHISLSPKVIHANHNSATDNLFYIDFKIYTLNTCVMRQAAEGVNMENFERNIQKIYKSIEKQGFRHGDPKPMAKNDLPFDLSRLGTGNASVNLLTIAQMIQQSRRNRYLKVKTKKKKEKKKKVKKKDMIN